MSEQTTSSFDLKKNDITMQPTLPKTKRDSDGSCWTCIRLRMRCDKGLPYCQNCVRSGIRCKGYRLRFKWPVDMSPKRASTRARPAERRNLPDSEGRTHAVTTSWFAPSTPLSLSHLSSSGLPAEYSYFMQHYLRNIARIALAVDYSHNGYRSLLPLALECQGLMDAIIALSASHYSRWQGTADTTSRDYLRRAAKTLKLRLNDSVRARDQTTIALMLTFISYEVFQGSSRWKAHYNALRSWVQSRGSCSDLDSFIKTWICMIDTQTALNLGSPGMIELEPWIVQQLAGEDRDALIDPLFGCSVRLPRLMSAASRLYSDSKKQPSLDIAERALELKRQIRATKLDMALKPSLRILCGNNHPFTLITDLSQHDLSTRIVATAEVFRLAMEIYVHRIAFNTLSDTTEIYETVQTSLELIASVPDASGPGANLGWCLVVIGSEVDSPEYRDYIRSRLIGLRQLGMYNSVSASKILEQVWSHRDLVIAGIAQPLRWQDVMQQIGEQQILV